MARRKSADQISSLETQQKELLQKLKAARGEAAKRRKADDERRAMLLGKAALKHLSRDDLATLIVTVIDGHTEAASDLALFDEWLKSPNATASPILRESADA